MGATAGCISLSNFGSARVAVPNARLSHSSLFVTGKANASEATLSVPEMIRSMRDNGLPIAAIADIARVERKTIYSWIDGSGIHGSNAERVQTIFRLLNGVYNNDLRSLYRVWNTRLRCGYTIKELMSVETPSGQLITESLNELAPTIRRYSDRDQRRPASQNSRISVIDEMPVAVLER